MSEKHTPGPWVVGDGGRMVLRDVPGICDGHDGYAVAVTSAHSLLPVEEARANARLIAAAPDLLAALKALQLQALQSNVNDPANDWGREALALTRAAIAAATGANHD